MPGARRGRRLADDHEHKVAATAPPQTADATKKPANAGELPPGSLESAFERAKTRLAISAGESMAA